MTKTYVEVGDTFPMRLSYSEVCTHMHVAGKRMVVRVVSDHMVQLLNDDGSDFSFPITTGEAGIYTDYTYDDNGNVVDRRHYVAESVPVVDMDSYLVIR